MNRLVLIIGHLVVLPVAAFAQSAAPARSVVDRAPTAADAGPAYQQDNLWLDPSGRSWAMREFGKGQAVWLAQAPSGRVVDAIGGAGPIAAYGTSRLAAAYEGPALNVVNSLAKTGRDIGFLPDGRLDEVALAGFCGIAECRVARWYDQSGHGNHASQPNPTAQPLINLGHRTGRSLSVVWDYEATSGGPVRSLVLPNSVVVDSGDAAVLWTGRFHNASQVSPLVELGADGNAFDFGYWDAHGDFYLGTPNHLNEVPGHAPLTASVGMISSSQEGLIVNYRNKVRVLGKLPSEQHRGGLIGQTLVYRASGMMELSSLVIYNRGLTGTERFASVKALGENFSIPQQQVDVYVADGDSLTQGIASPYLQAYPWYLENLLPRSLLMYNAGWAAKTLGGAGGLVERYDGFTSKLYNASARRNILSLMAGSNDLQGGSDEKEVFRLVQRYAAEARKTGFKFVIATIIPRSTFNAKAEAARLAVNAMIRARWKDFADAIVDLASNAVFADPKIVSDGTIYSEDGTHLTDTGYQVVAFEFSGVIAGLAD